MSKLTDLAAKFYELRQEKDSLTFTLKEVSKKLDTIENEMLEEMGHEGLCRLDVKGKGSFFTSSRKFYKIIDRDAFMDFIHDQGDTDLLSVQHNTLNAYADEIYTRKVAEGNKNFVLPGVEFFEKVKIRMRKLGNDSDNESDED